MLVEEDGYGRVEPALEQSNVRIDHGHLPLEGKGSLGCDVAPPVFSKALERIEAVDRPWGHTLGEVVDRGPCMNPELEAEPCAANLRQSVVPQTFLRTEVESILHARLRIVRRVRDRPLDHRIDHILPTSPYSRGHVGNRPIQHPLYGSTRRPSRGS